MRDQNWANYLADARYGLGSTCGLLPLCYWGVLWSRERDYLRLAEFPEDRIVQEIDSAPLHWSEFRFLISRPTIVCLLASDRRWTTWEINRS